MSIQDMKKQFLITAVGAVSPSVLDLEKAYYEKALDGSLPGAPVSWNDLTDKPEVIASGATQEAARTAIGAGTSSLTIGTTASTAKAGNYQPTVAQVTGLQAILTDLENRIAALETPE